jgi:hypothetical protein
LAGHEGHAVLAGSENAHQRLGDYDVTALEGEFRVLTRQAIAAGREEM